MHIVVNEKFRLVLENEINKKLESFTRMGRHSKRLLMYHKNNMDSETREIVLGLYHSMANVLHDLEPYIPLIKEQNPHMAQLIDMLLWFDMEDHMT